MRNPVHLLVSPVAASMILHPHLHRKIRLKLTCLQRVKTQKIRHKYKLYEIYNTYELYTFV